MTEFSNIRFTATDVVKLGGLIVALATQFYLLKSEIHDAKSSDKADKQVINYRLTELERCCNISAIKPEEIKIETR